MNQHVRVQEILAGAGGSRLLVDDIEVCGVVDPPSSTIVDSVLVVDRIHDDIGRTRAEGPYTDAV